MTRLVSRGQQQIVLNLLANATKFTPSGGRTDLDWRVEHETLCIRISDTGPGIPQEHRELIFTEGWSTKKPPAHRERGIGLSLVRRLAERQGGSATVDDAGGGGAEFTVVLPDALEPEPEPALTAPRTAQPATEEESC